MLVVTLSAGDGANCAFVDGRPLVVARDASGSFLMGARCPHRGGPLQLGTLDEATGCVVCPWHGTAHRVRSRRLARTPIVRRGDMVTAVLAPQEDVEPQVAHRPVSRGLRRPGA